MSWLISKALMNSLCSQAQAVEFLGESCLDGTQSAQLSGNHTQQAYCAPDKMTDFSRLSRFGITVKPLTESRGAELLTLYLADFPAKTLAAQGEEQELTESDQECGEKWHASFAKYDPVTHSLRTHQCSLFEDLTESCVTLPRWGLMRDGECWEQQTLEQTIKGTESGLSLEMFPTPVCIDAGSGMFNTSVGSSNKRPTLAMMARKNLWPTPTVNDSKNSTLPESQRNRDGLAGSLLRLGEQAGGHLNPTWTEWLMGLPLGWTDLKPLVTHKSLFVQPKPSEFLAQTCEI
ncbi:hypothetical protein [uncultured Limnobacter sp.]|uniref:hypothetical protein n=1 Tax=uncultured Limnobacter sp. TaxID=199681 RepID=UPI0030F9E1C7